MDDLISRKALIAEYDRVHVGPPGGARKLMEVAPAVDAVEVVHAHWVVLDDDFYGKPVYCSHCLEHFYIKKDISVDLMKERNKFCFNCGADMRERKEP